MRKWEMEKRGNEEINWKWSSKNTEIHCPAQHQAPECMKGLQLVQASISQASPENRILNTMCIEARFPSHYKINQ